MLTKRQKQVLDYITSYSKKRGYSPSLEEIQKHFKLASVSTAHFHVKKLQDLGLLDKQFNKPRSIDIYENEKMVNIPLLGSIAAGKPIEAIQNKETIVVPQTKLPRIGEFYALRVIGDSMIDENINNGDIVLVKQQSIAENGQKVVALVDNYEATLKKFYKERGYIRLQPANKTIEPIIVKKDRELSIQGIVIDIIKNEEDLQTKVLPPQKEIKKNDVLPINKIICGDCVKIMKTFPDNSIDMVVTSPPYDEVRDYKGFKYNLHETGQELYRILKDGGVIAMVIQDQTKNFGKSLTSFKTIVDWVDNIGFKLFETVIYRKYGAEGAWWNKRFRVDHEYIPIFLKGERPQYFNKEPIKIPSKHGGKTMTGGGTRLTNGVRIATRSITINPTKCRGTIWEYMTAGDGTRLKHQHPATFPDRLPYDFIQCFCPPNGIVLDPFVGSGTTALAAIKLEKKYIGIDISRDYCELSKKRIKEKSNIYSFYIRKELKIEPQKKEAKIAVRSKTIDNFINKVVEGDCLEVMREFPSKSIDMILCDLPYGMTQNHWDSVIPLDKLWGHYERIIKDTGVIALTSQGLFTAQLMLSNPKLFKYKITWVKSKPTNFLNAKKQPLRKHEDVCIFYKKQPIYNPQMAVGEPYNKGFRKDQLTGSYGDFKTVEVKSNGERYPADVIYFKTAESEGPVLHPTQKPIELGRYLIKTFTRKGDVVLDNACGSGSFLVSAVLEGRKFIGIEKNQEVYLFKKKKVDYIEVCNRRIKEAQEQNKTENNKLKLF